MTRLAFFFPLLAAVWLLAQAVGQQATPVLKLDPAMARLRLKLNPEFPNWGPPVVVERCAEHLATINEAARLYIRYFDLSSVHRQELPTYISSLHYICNGHTVATLATVPRAVPNTDNRIFWIDLRWYRWDPRVWENITNEDFFFREPLIPSDSEGLNFLRLSTLSAGPIVRADWFIFYTIDATQFLAKDATKADNAFCYQLTYGLKDAPAAKTPAAVPKTRTETVTEKVPVVRDVLVRDSRGRTIRQQQTVMEERQVTKEVPVATVPEPDISTVGVQVNAPQTAAEFEKFWRVDFEALKDYPIDIGAMVDEGKSGVSFRNRILWRVRSTVGVYWRTFDVFRSVGDQNFVESPFPKEFDAGEHIFQDAKGAQHYMLSAGKGTRVEFGDPRVVSGQSAGHPAVITSMGCIQCHTDGIIMPSNEHLVLRDIGASLVALGYERSERFRQFFLDNSLKRRVEQDQVEYTEFIRACNGLSPQQNAAQINRARTLYAKGVTLEQAAREIGCTAEELEKALGEGIGTAEKPMGVTRGRLGRLALQNEPIPRLTWEREDYAVAFLTLLEHRKSVKIREQGKDSK